MARRLRVRLLSYGLERYFSLEDAVPMRSTDTTVSELAFIFKLLPIIQEVDTVDRLYRFLLAIVTSGRTFGYSRAMLFTPDDEASALRGWYGVERQQGAGRSESDGTGAGDAGGFDKMARSVFRNFENVDASDLTVSVRSYSVPLSWHRSAIVKAYRTTYPVLAERNLSEFATDTFFEFFGATSYIAVPIEFDRKVMAVLVVDRSSHETRGTSDEISLLCSIVQQTAGAAHRLLEAANDRRRTRILVKLRDSLVRATTESEFEESLKAALVMIGRAVGATVCVLKDQTARKTFRVQTAAENENQASDAGFPAIEEILDLAAGTMEPVNGDGSDGRLKDRAGDLVEYFSACPLVAGSESLGALAAYTQKNDHRGRQHGFAVADRAFLELSAGIVASSIQNRRKLEKIGRLEEFIEEMSSSLVRERERSRIGDKSIEYHSRIDEGIKQTLDILSRKDAPSRLSEISNALETMRRHSETYAEEVSVGKTGYAMTDLFELVRAAAERVRSSAEKQGVQLTTRMAEHGAVLLLDRKSVTDALSNILSTTLSCLAKGDQMLVECSLVGSRAIVCVADSGRGVPGDIISRLFMPFVDAGERHEKKRALSLAGDILQKHSAEIMIKSSRSWRTILVLSFPLAAGKDRRRSGADRRKRGDRRTSKGSE